jgi:hypothetical protein
MYPWLWLWAPRIELPWSGNVVQDIEPNTSWFFGSIKPEAGNAKIEQKAFDVATYGKQLGLITELLVSLAEKQSSLDPKVLESLKELKRIQGEIDLIKDAEYETELRDIQTRIKALRKRRPAQTRALVSSLKIASASSGA